MRQPLRVLVLHNTYQLYGGEDAVVAAEVALLREHAHDVAQLTRRNDELSGMTQLSAGLQALWSRDSAQRTADAISRHQPQVVHVHNTWPLLSPSVYAACKSAGVPVVQTLHNFRLACPQAMFLREARVCTDCLGRLPWPAVRHACYRSSRTQTAVLAATLTLHRGLGTWRHQVDRYIALNDFCRGKLIEAGLPASRMVVKPHFVDAPAPAVGQARSGFLYAGRLAPEKGLQILQDAARMLAAQAPWAASQQVWVAGTGPLSTTLTSSSAPPGRLHLLGELSLPELQQRMGRARALVLPSICLESFPRVLVEAFAAGLPVIASRLGALAELVQDGETGLLFEPSDAQDLSDKMAWAASHPEEMAGLGRRAREVYEAEYTPRRNLAQLLEIYRQAGAQGATDAATGLPASR